MPRRTENHSPESGTTEVSDLGAHLGFWLRFVSNHVSARFRRLVEERGVTVSEWVALRETYGDEPANVPTLVERLGMTKGAVSKVLDRLEQKKLAKRVADPGDGRAQRVVLTPRGRALVPELAALADDNEAHFFGHLDEGARASLEETFRGLVRTHGLTHVPTE